MYHIIQETIKLFLQGKNESEWRAALKFAELDCFQSKVLHIEAIPLGNVEWNTGAMVKFFVND